MLGASLLEVCTWLARWEHAQMEHAVVRPSHDASHDAQPNHPMKHQLGVAKVHEPYALDLLRMEGSEVIP
jgi:hypothetical protein